MQPFYKPLALVLLISVGWGAHAQRQLQGSFWADVDAVYSSLSYNEPDLSATEAGRFAGVRGDLGVSLMPGLGVTLGGDYTDGNMNYTGKTLTGASVSGYTGDYIRTEYGLVEVNIGYFILSGGFATREWYDRIPSAYRRYETMRYYPVIATFTRGMFYLKGEYDFGDGGSLNARLSDTGAEDLVFSRSGGSGYALEFGAMIPTAMGFQDRIFIGYRRFSVAAAGTQSDGASNISVGSNNTTILQAGIGVSF